MKRNFENHKLKLIALIMFFSFMTLLNPDMDIKNSISFASTREPVLSEAETPGAVSNECFRLVETRILDAVMLSDDMLDEISPALVARKPARVTQLTYNQRTLREYNRSVCFKRCHTPTDFSASDYTYKQWCLLIEQNGHSIFSEIPWDNPDMKETTFKYLLNNAKNETPDPEGIGEWN